jgi:hypothetical protein
MRRLLVALLACALPACGDNDEPAPVQDPGALVEVTIESRVGVLLDELPEAAREALAADLLAQPASFWEARARRQIEATNYRLIYRNFYGEGIGQLPLPPVEQWQVTAQAAQRTTIDGHDLVAAPYGFRATLLTPLGEPALADPLLGDAGGVVEEIFVLPVDPEQLLERTGFACLNEAESPPNSVDAENALSFFDDACTAGLADGCHITPPIPDVSCVEALEAAVGRVDVAVRFERLAWDEARADAVRTSAPSPGGPQFVALEDGLSDHRIVYRWFDEGACAIAEGCVGAPGWRRLLQFTASMHNVGDEDALLGDVGPGSIIVANNMVSLSACHGHMHFNHYGNFNLGGDGSLGSKRAFCLESTSRYSNNETTPLVHPYTCHFQGTAAGWGDDYIAGLDCQWIDITTVDSTGGVTDTLVFEVNPDQFLCEGQLVTDEDGTPLFEPTEFRSELGDVEYRFQCEQRSDAAEDNVAEAQVAIPGEGGLVTGDCKRPQFGPTRNCGFTRAADAITCTATENVNLRCTGGSDAVPAAIRVCEASHLLGGIPCTFREALVTGVSAGGDLDLTFTCPGPRSTEEPGGLAHVYVGPPVDGDDVSGVSCEVL